MSLYFDKPDYKWHYEWNEFVEVVLTKTNSKENDILEQIKKQIINDKSKDDIKIKIVEEMYKYFEKIKNLEKLKKEFENLEKLKKEFENLEELEESKIESEKNKNNNHSIVSNRIKHPITRKNKYNYKFFTKLTKTPEKTPKTPEKTPEEIIYKKKGGKCKSKKNKGKNHGLKKTIHKRMKPFHI